uniref:DNA-directed DNA polymerase n=1 Tax=Pithovirus LCPAC202 TaxID=2506592 RepID=A0A481Z9L6_9VIRU|nr:MAG: DNA polymerase elongation subunit family B [Pithovirus LCPAC202]
MRELDPEIVTGYNIFGFDYPYLNKRLIRKGLKWPAMGRLLHSKETVMGGNTWSSSGYGHNSIKYLDMDGRINVDMMHIIKREHKLPTYTLEAVGQHFLGAGKNDVPAEMMFDIVTLMKMLQDVLETFREPAENGGGEKIPQILFALKTSDSIIEYIRRKQAEKQMLTPKEYNQIIELVEYVLDEMNKIAKYCIKDSVLVLNLFSKLNVWVYLIQLSNIAGVTPLQLFTRGQQIRGLSLIYDLAARSGFVLDSRHYTPMSWSGGFVWEPIPGLWHWVICLDFKSLYPNIIRAYNICWTTLIPSWSAVKDECCNIIEWDEPIDKDDYIKEGDDPDENGTGKKKIPPGMGKVIIKMENGEEIRYIHYRFKFIKKEYRVGLLPQQAGMLIDERNKIRAAMKNITDPGEKNIMQQRQLAMKVTANSLFGLLGAGEHGRLPLVEGAMCITAKGRELIKFSNEYLVEKYNASIIYNDTDSTMVQIPGVTNGPDCLIWGKKLELELSAIFPDPLYLEFEKAGRQLTIKKKMYVFWILDERGELPRDKDGNPKYMVKGLPLARRDKSKWQLSIVRSSLDMIIQAQPHREFLDMVIKYVITTLRGKHDWRLFSIIKSLGSGYKKQTYFMKVFADQLRLIGKPAKPGDRLTFVIVEPRDHPKDCLLGYKMRLLDTYLERIHSDRPEQINYYYYINNLLMDCIDNYWRVGYKPIIDKIEAQNELDDKWKILNELKETGLGNWVTSALNSNDQDPKRAVEGLMLSKVKNKTIMARRKHISGRKVFDCRISGKPIKTLLKGYTKGRLEEAVKSLASPELYNELYPKLKITGKNGFTIQLNIS